MATQHTAVTNKWEALCSFSDVTKRGNMKKLSELHAINKNEFIATVLDTPGEHSYKIRKYNIKTNKFKDFSQCEISKSEMYSQYISTCYDTQQQYLYIFCSRKTVYKFNIKTREKITTQIPQRSIGIYPCSIWTPQQGAHLIGGFSNSRHIIWYNDAKKLNAMHKFQNMDGCPAAGVVYLKHMNKLIFFGGFTRKGNDIKMREFCLKSSTWSEMQCNLPYPMTKPGYVVTNDERYIVILGANTSKEYQEEAKDTIQLLDIGENKWFTSKIKMPTSNMCRAIIMGNVEEDSCLVYGYLRENKLEKELPLEIIEMIAHWFVMEFVHLVDRSNGNHWNIPLEQILQNMTECTIEKEQKL